MHYLGTGNMSNTRGKRRNQFIKSRKACNYTWKLNIVNSYCFIITIIGNAGNLQFNSGASRRKDILSMLMKHTKFVSHSSKIPYTSPTHIFCTPNPYEILTPPTI